jgi:hypothetical protein
MNKRRRQILRTRTKPAPPESRDSRSSAAAFFKSVPFRVLLALFGAIVVCIFALHAFTTKKSEMKSAAKILMPEATGATSPAQTLPREKEISDAAMLADADQAHPELTTNQQHATGNTPAPNLATAPPSPGGSNTTSSPSPQDIAKESTEARRSVVERKNVEKRRLHAERKRSRLETMYQNHLISNEAYKSGQEEYKNEIEKYRLEMNGAASIPQ